MMEDFHPYAHLLLCLCSQARGAHLEAFLSLGRYRWKGLFTIKGHAKNQPQQIILALGLTALKFNSLLTEDFFKKILSNGD